MFSKTEYWERRNKGLRGQTGGRPEEKLVKAPKDIFMVNVKGKEVHVPRRQKRATMRKFYRDLMKGRINLMDVINQNDRQE